jgi:predicted nucleotidyltransferase component of viral defense system
MSRQRVYFEILDAKRRAMLPRLQFLRDDYGFYLAGGTALALQIRHRRSVDFDFYTPREFKPLALYKRLERLDVRTGSRHVAEGTLMALVNGIEMSFFQYSYPLLRPLVSTEYLNLLSVQDIAAMKMVSIVQRGAKRDYVDLYFLLKKHSLEDLLSLTEKKYSIFNRYLGLRALVYFDDAEKDVSRARLEMLERAEWDQVKKTLVETVDAYRRERLKG